jgi:hypothetical protein
MSLSPRRLLWPALALLALGAPLLAGRWLTERPSALGATLTADCDVNRGPCRVPLPGGGSAEFAISPHPVPLMQPLAVSWTEPSLPATAQVSVELDGAEMTMGFNRATLHADAAGVFRGTAILPVCATGAMRWQATLRVAGRGPAVRFLFATPAQR